MKKRRFTGDKTTYFHQENDALLMEEYSSMQDNKKGIVLEVYTIPFSICFLNM